MITLKNEFLTVTADPKGAELTSVLDADGIQRLWQADPKVWGRHAPLLFPIIGRLRNNQYALNGELWSISTHGFGRDSLFTVAEQSGTSVTFRLEDSEATRAVYPFSFVLEVSYALEGRTIRKTHNVTNRSDSPMPFEVGGHDGYCTTLLPGETMADYYIEFEGIDELAPHIMESGTCFVAPEKRVIPLDRGRWQDYRPFLAEMDTAVIDRLPVNKVTLATDQNDKKVVVRYEELPYLGIWTPSKDFDTNYVCLEPWSALPECTDTDAELAGKKGILIAQPGETVKRGYTMEFLG